MNFGQHPSQSYYLHINESLSLQGMTYLFPLNCQSEHCGLYSQQKGSRSRVVLEKDTLVKQQEKDPTMPLSHR